MVNIKTLLPELRALVTELAEDLLARVTAAAGGRGAPKSSRPGRSWPRSRRMHS